MAKAVPAVQLHGKQPWPQQVKKNGQKAKGQRAKAKSKTTFRSQALKDGSLPPARRPIFVRDNVRGQKGCGEKRMAAWDEALGRHVAQVAHCREAALLWTIGCRVCHYESRKCQQCSASRQVTRFQNLRSLSWSEATRSWLRTSGPPDCHQLGWQRFPLHGQVSTEMCCEDLQEEECVLRPQPWELHFASCARPSRPDSAWIFPLHFGSLAQLQAFPVFLEYCGSSLFSLLGEKGAFSVDDSHTIALQLKAAVRGLHALQILHLDLKTSNVLLVCSPAPAQVGRLRDVWVYPWSWFSCLRSRLHPSFAYVCNSKLPSPRVVACYCGGPRKVVEACCWFVVVWVVFCMRLQLEKF